LPACLTAAGDPWLKITSANFELYTTAGERAGRDLVKHFEEVRSFFTQAFGSRLANARPARIIAFRNEKEYQPYRPSEFASAFYQPGAIHDFIVMSGASKEHYPVAIHEFTHLMIHQSGMELPPWLNEGLAELYSSLEPRGNQILVGQVMPGRVQVLSTGNWIPLATLLSVDHNSPYYSDRSHAGMFYAESWALVHMLNLEPEYRPHMNALALALKDQPPEAAFARAYGKRIDEIESALHDYFHAATIHAELFNLQLPKSLDAPEVETGATLPARVALAELLGNSRGRGEQARTAWEQLARDFPRSWEVESGWAEFDWRQRRLEDSAGHFARALVLGCKDEQSLLLYARVLGYNRRDQDAAAVLLNAVKLYPESSEIHLELGATLVRTGSYAAAAGALTPVKKLATPGQAYRLYYNLAYAQFRLGDAPHALESLAKARTFTKNPTELASLDRLQQAVGFPLVEGTLENMECGTLARLHVRVDGAVKIFLFPDPTKAPIGVELQCGPQVPPRALRIEYQELPSASGATGLIRTLEFQ
jgi:tetratricopeptide (TPR) repeat protein